jgi:hypothetical protein
MESNLGEARFSGMVQPSLTGLVSFPVRYPARIPHPGQLGLGNVPGYFHSRLSALHY